MACEKKCFEDFIGDCPEEITINCGLEPLELYKWIVTDSRGNVTEQSFITDIQGNGVLSLSALPGLCSEASAGFTVQVKVSANDCEFQQMTIPTKYTCI